MPAKKPTPRQAAYQKSQKYEPKPKALHNAVFAFLSGELSPAGQALTDFGGNGSSPEKAANPAVATMIFFGALLTALGLLTGSPGLPGPVLPFR